MYTRKLKITLAFILCIGFLCGTKNLGAVERPKMIIHSHNDYWREFPFYQAYQRHITSIEADVYYPVDKRELLVAHNEGDLKGAPTLEESYILPLVNLFKKNGGTAWKNSKDTLQLLIDLKHSENGATLNRIVQILQKYPDVFDSSINPYAVKVVISGEMPKPDDFYKYPSMIYFDGRPTIKYTRDELSRIAMVSASMRDYTLWNGKGSLLPADKEKVANVIKQTHLLGKKLRLWDTPDGPTSWNTLYEMGLDIISTNDINDCSDFFNKFYTWRYELNNSADVADHKLMKVKILDKATVGFNGFDRAEEGLTHRIPVYHPVYTYKHGHKKVKNVILLIGDGMGLAEVCAAETVNNGLSMLQCNYVGLQENSSKDAHTTDSAGAGSALATGQSTDNRHISTGTDGGIHPSMTDVLQPLGYACGVVTLGDLADATPAVFYGHSTERDSSDEITDGLLSGKLTLLNGSGMKAFTNRKDGKDFLSELKKRGYRIATSIGQINAEKGKVICVDELMDKAATEGSLPLLSQATGAAIKKLQENNRKGFFLMVEGAKIDYAGHANSLAGSVLETLSFDMAVSKALQFADSNGETLVIVTADHETGGMSLVDGNRKKGLISVRFTTNDHTPIMIPVYAYGPGAKEFTGVYKNTRIFHKIKRVLNVK